MLFDDLRTGKVNRAKRVSECFGGKALNSARALSCCSIPATLLSFCSKGDDASIRAELPGIEFHPVYSTTPIRVCTTLMDESASVTELVEEQESHPDETSREFLNRAENLIQEADSLLIAGSLPANFPKDTYQKWADIAESVGCKLCCDLHGERLQRFLQSPPFLLKPNLDELQSVIHNPSNKSLDQWIRECYGRIYPQGDGVLYLSDGARGAWLAHRDTVKLIPAPSVKVVNSTGAGDTSSAILTALLHDKRDWEEKARLAVLAGSVQCESEVPGHLPPSFRGHLHPFY